MANYKMQFVDPKGEVIYEAECDRGLVKLNCNRKPINYLLGFLACEFRPHIEGLVQGINDG